MKIIEMRPPAIAIALSAFAAVLHMSSSIWEAARFAAPRTGIFVGVAGFGLMMWPWVLFKRGKLAVCIPEKTAYILTTGPYRFSRNPMYMGMVLMMTGTALYFGTLPFYISAAVFFMILNLSFCPFEENKLMRAFGEEYRQYMNRSRRWI